MKLKRKHTAVLIIVVLLALGMMGYIILYPEIEWRHRMTVMLREEPYVRLYDEKRSLVAKIEEPRGYALNHGLQRFEDYPRAVTL